MLIAAIAAVLGSAAIAYLIGYAFVAPRGSALRSRWAVRVLIFAAVTLMLLPPQLMLFGEAGGSIVEVLGPAAAWPDGLGKGPYVAAWLVTTLLAALAGLRIWQAGTPEWRADARAGTDASPASRVHSLLPLADRIEDALDALARSGLAPRDLPRVAPDVREAGRRFGDSLPPTDGEVFRLVASRVPAALAGDLTGLLLEGAGRRPAAR